MKLLLIDKLRYLTTIRRLATKKDAHNPEEIESKWYDLWQKKLHNAYLDTNRPYFSMILPPPNVTGTLHLGHAITLTIQDVIIRRNLMNGYRTVWIPGVDHAGIATQVIVERKLWNERKLTRHDLGKEKFIKEVQNWKEHKTNEIKNQTLKLNSLLNWDREYFTMDNKISQSVTEAFIRLFESGYITRSQRLVNWCCALKSTISDIEINTREINEPVSIQVPNYKRKVDLGYIHLYSYPIYDSNEQITIATTRPETMFGDVAVAVNPNDSRYSNLQGKFALNPLTNEKIPIIFDDSVLSEFQTGAVKITPAHDFNDYLLGERHNLPLKKIFDETGHLINVPNEYLAKNRFEARYNVVKALDSLGLYKGKKQHQMAIPLCSRTSDILEPMLKEQWFIKTEDMFKKCGEAVKNGLLELIPKSKESPWYEYTNKYTKDWCISRQLWWGQQIPAYKAKTSNGDNKWFAAPSEKEAKKKAQDFFKTENVEITQDEDVFDTWFSSALLPIAVFNWPNIDSSFDRLYPTNLLETGHDIMFFWVLRMAALCHTLSNKLPFKQVLFHGLILDSLGRKMSKSIGNIIDPIHLIDGASLETLQKGILESNLDEKEKKLSLKNQQLAYPNGLSPVGSDALRLSLLVQDFTSDSMKVDMNIFISNKHYCNKIWQATRYIEIFNEKSKREKFCLNELLDNKNLRLIDKWILRRLANTIKTVNENLDNYNFYVVVNSLRSFFYQDFCDFYVESSKVGKDEPLVGNILNVCLEQVLILYHPFMPSITEELWHRMKYDKLNSKESILDIKYSTLDKIDNNEYDDSVIQTTQKIIESILSVKKTFQLNEKPKLYIKCMNDSLKKSLVDLNQEIIFLSKSNELIFDEPIEKSTNGRLFEFKITDYCILYVFFNQKVDIQIEIKKIDDKIEKLNRDIGKLNDKLNKGEKYSDENKKSFQLKIKEHKDSIETLFQQKQIIFNSK